jgi:hypothetical protein
MVQIHCAACTGPARERDIATVTDGPAGVHVRQARRRISLAALTPPGLRLVLDVKRYADVSPNVPLNATEVDGRWLFPAASNPIKLTCRHHGTVVVPLVDVTEAISAWRSDPRRRIRHITAQTPVVSAPTTDPNGLELDET